MRRAVSAAVLFACLPVTACAATTASRATPAVTVTRTVPGAAPAGPSHAAADATPASPAPATTATPAASGAAVRTAYSAPPRPHLTNASAVVAQYYQDITDHDYAAAWALGGSRIAGTTYDRWVAGFDTTERIALGTVSVFGASSVHAVLYATQTDGTLRTYAGDYVVAGGVLVGASISRTG